MAKEQLLATLRGLLRDTMRARYEGGPYGALARANGAADGYMRALLDAGLVDQRELLAFVGAERNRFLDEAPSLAPRVA